AAAKKLKAYQWILNVQLPAVMPNALPSPTAAANYNYWAAYLDYVMSPSNGPANQDSDRIEDFNNPNNSTFPNASSNLPKVNQSQIGYMTYVQFMMDWGRDRSPEQANSSNSNPGLVGKTPLSLLSPDCPLHTEGTPAGDFSFPPREQPTHAVRRSLIAALKVIEDLNGGLPNGAGDRVSLVTFDAIDQYHSPELVVPLTGNYRTAMDACTELQAVGDINASTATEYGLIKARQHIAPVSAGGQGRTNSTKVVVLLTDGVPNIYSSSSSTINSYIKGNPDSNFYSGSASQYNSVLMQADQMKTDNVEVFSVGMGLGADLDFMDRIARINGTDSNGLSPRGTGNPDDYEERLTEIFQNILEHPGTRLVD
ncbi:MAG: vWA domain-containing protein, partial [Planctomycetaceae bacterium]